jgi:hypothetical protein
MHTRSVQQWISKEGLMPIAGSRNPYLIHGKALAVFLDAKREKHKCALNEHEFYCLKCRCARASVPSELSVVKTNIRIGNKGKFKATKTGRCEVCGTKINRFCTYEQEATNEIN